MSGNRPGGSAAQGRPWCLQWCGPLAAGEADAGQTKGPLFSGAGRGLVASAQPYPVAPGAVAVVIRAATGLSCAFMDRIIMHCRACVKRPSPLDMGRVRTLG